MKRAFLLAAAIAACLASPVAALTLEQAQSELAGMYCDADKCVSYVETSTTVDLPDIELPDTQLPDVVTTKPFGGQTIITYRPLPSALCDRDPVKYAWACDGETATVISTGIQKRTIVTPGDIIDGGVIDGGTETTTTCTRTKKVLTYNGPYTSRDMAWSVETTVATQDGACP